MKCDICTKSFLRPTRFHKHKLSHTKFTCTICGIFKKNQLAFEKHKHAKHAFRKCDQCEFEGANHKVNIHQGLVHATKALLSCKFCDYTANKKGDMKRHGMLEHVMTLCRKCCFKGNKKEIKAHRRNPESCKRKSRKVKKSRDNLGHIKILNNSGKRLKMSTVTNKVQDEFQHKIECSTCLIKFPPSAFEDHKKACFYYCPECSYKTKTVFGLNNHLGSHKDTQQVECEMCQTTFPKSKIKDHKETCFYWCPKCPYKNYFWPQ